MVVSAQDITTVTQVGGDLAVAGDVAVGVAATVGVINKDTQAWIAADADVTALTQGAAVTANTGQFQGNSGIDAQQSAAPILSFATSALDTATGVITIANHGLSTGDQIVYGDAHTELSGLQNGGVYYVIAIDANHIELARTLADAQAGIAIALTDGSAAATDQNSIQKITDVGVPAISTTAFTGASNGTTTVPFGAPLTAQRQGVVVVAVSGNTIQSAGVAVGGAGVVAVNVAGAVAVDTLTTEAHIDAGAKVAATGSLTSGDPAVFVDAGRTYRDLAIGGGANGAGGVSVAPAVAVPVLEGTTEAQINGATVTATGDVEVRALAEESIIAVAAGFSASGIAGVAGSAAAVSVGTASDPTQTIAEIAGGATVTAGGNVLVLANDDTTDYAIAGAIGIGIGGGGGAGAVALSLLNKDVYAVIDNSTVAGAGNTAGVPGVLVGQVVPSGSFSQQTVGGVVVQAASNETVYDVAGSGAGGLYAGVAGAVTAEVLNVNVQASIQDAAKVSSAEGSVAVGAGDQVTELDIAGALGGGIVGIGAGVDINVLRNNTIADITDSTVTAGMGAVELSAQTLRGISSYADAVGAGGLALGGGIAVLSIGGNFNSDYSATGGKQDSLGSNGGPSVTSSVDSEIGNVLGSTQPGSTTALPPINPQSAVVGNQIDFGTATKLQTGATVVYNGGGGTPIGGLQNGATYFVIADPSDPDRISLAATLADADAGKAITLNGSLATGTNQRFVAGGAGIQADAQSQNSTALPTSNPVSAATGNASGTLASGTTAAIDGGAVITAHSVAVEASQAMTATVEAGGAGLGGGLAIGVGVVVVNVQSDVSAFVGDASLISVGAGALTIDATRTSTINALGLEGSLSGFVALGGAAAVVSDTSSVTALLGGEPMTGGGYGAPLAPASADGFGAVTIDATQNAAIDLSTWAVTISYAAAAGAAVTVVTLTPDTTAAIGPGALIGTNTEVGSVSVQATQSTSIAGFPNATPGFTPGNDIGVGATAGGLLAGTATYTSVTVGGKTDAEIGNKATVNATGDVWMNAFGTINAGTLRVDGGALGAVAIGVMIGTASLTPTVDTRVGTLAVVHGGSIEVLGTNVSNVSLTVSPAAGGIGAGTGGVVSATGTVTTDTLIDTGAQLLATGNISVGAQATPSLTVNAEGHDYGGVTVGVSQPTVTLTNTTTAEIGGGASLYAALGGLGSSQDISVLAQTNDTAQALATGAGGALISIEYATANGTLTDTTSALVDAKAEIDATGTVAIDSLVTLNGTVNPVVNTGGLGVGANSTGTLTVNSTTTVDIGMNASIAGNVVSVLSHLQNATITDQASATATAAGDSSSSSATLTDTLNTLLTIESGATITGQTSATFQALQDVISTTGEADATSNAAFASTTPTATNVLNDYATVTANAGSEVDTRALDVESDAPYTPGVSAIANQDGTWAGATIGSASASGTLTLDREIHWSALVRELGAPDPTLTVSPTGVVTATGITWSEPPGSGAVDVNNIAYTGALSGTATFRIAGSSFDGQTSVGNVTVDAKAVFSPAPTIIFSSTFDKVTIDNQSALALNVNNIDPRNTSASITSNIVFEIPGNPSITPTVSIVAGPTTIRITNDGSPDLDLLGNINNPLGTTFITANGGNIVAGPDEQLETTTLSLNAGRAIGSPAATAQVATPRQLDITATAAVTATAGADLHLLQSGDLALASIMAGTTADLSASGSILGRQRRRNAADHRADRAARRRGRVDRHQRDAHYRRSGRRAGRSVGDGATEHLDRRRQHRPGAGQHHQHERQHRHHRSGQHQPRRRQRRACICRNCVAVRRHGFQPAAWRGHLGLGRGEHRRRHRQ